MSPSRQQQLTYKGLLRFAQDFLVASGDDEASEAALQLLCAASGLSRSCVYETNKKPDSKVIARFKRMLKRRAKIEPVAYITGSKGFWTDDIVVSRDVLVPRPETEFIIEAALSRFSKNAAINIWDVCTGSGCVAAALGYEFPNAKILASDFSKKALIVARKNLKKFGARAKVAMIDLLQKKGRRGEAFDLIVSNPPYVKTSDLKNLPKPVQFEPRLALDGGKDGMDVLRKLILEAPDHMKKGAWLILETGLGQTKPMLDYARACKAYCDFVVAKDLSGIDRVISLRRS